MFFHFSQNRNHAYPSTPHSWKNHLGMFQASYSKSKMFMSSRQRVPMLGRYIFQGHKQLSQNMKKTPPSVRTDGFKERGTSAHIEAKQNTTVKPTAPSTSTTCPPNWWISIWVFPKIGVPQKWMVYNGKPY